MKARIENNLVVLEFKYDKILIEKIKKIPNSRYWPEKRNWSIPCTNSNIELVKKLGFEIIEENNIKFENEITTKKTLFHFQKEGVLFLEQKQGRALLADEMGLGKTIQVLAYLNLHPELRPALIICPASLKLNWEAEIKDTMTTEEKVVVVSGTKPYSISNATIIIANYDIVENWKEELIRNEIKIVVLDECHYIKNSSAQRTKAVKELCKGIKKIIALSGTPIVNRPVEFYNSISLINPYLFKNFWQYAQRYCAPKHNGFGWNFNGASNTKELHEILTSTIMIRRTKKEVLSELPEKIYNTIPVEIDRTEYSLVLNDLRQWLIKNEKYSKVEAVTKIEYLKQVAVKGKLNSVVEFIEDFLENEEKLVVFATHHFVIDYLIEKFKNISVKFDGRDSEKDKEKAVFEFQNNEKIRLFIGNIKAAGVGITLTASSNVLFVELPWTPGELVQAEDRCHRIGQKNCVNIYYLIARNTIEENILKILSEKQQILSQVLDGQDIEETIFKEIIEQLNKNNYDYEY